MESEPICRVFPASEWQGWSSKRQGDHSICALTSKHCHISDIFKCNSKHYMRTFLSSYKKRGKNTLNGSVDRRKKL